MFRRNGLNPKSNGNKDTQKTKMGTNRRVWVHIASQMYDGSESGAQLANQLLWGLSKTDEGGGGMQPPHLPAAVARLASKQDN